MLKQCLGKNSRESTKLIADEINGFHAFPKGISPKWMLQRDWNSISLILRLQSSYASETPTRCILNQNVNQMPGNYVVWKIIVNTCLFNVFKVRIKDCNEEGYEKPSFI